MAKKGRPFVYQSEDEKPVTVSLRLPRDVYAQVARYVKRHPGMTLTEFFLEGHGSNSIHQQIPETLYCLTIIQ